jgi:mono/diheme cytochrome c family protein
MNAIRNIAFALITAVVLMTSACQQPGVNSPGSEYMPDMGHSIAYEANVYTDYRFNTWDSASVKKLKELSVPGEPVAGTVARGFAGVHFSDDMQSQQEMMKVLTGQKGSGVSTPVNGSVPYYYEDTEEERQRAIAEIINNPYPITADGLERGKELYDIFCGICHGEKGDGAGYLVREADPAKGDPGGKYPAAPANFLLDEHVNASNGRYYHAIMYGKNAMGAYKDKISYEERWQVIHYIRSLQAKELKMDYSAEANTLNSAHGIPFASIEQTAMHDEDAHHEEGMHTEGDDHHSEGDHHSDDAGHSEGEH